MARRAAACAALAAIVALAGVAQAAIHFPNVPFPFSDKEKHSVLAINHAIVGQGHLLSTNAAGVENKMQGGFQLLTRTAMPGTPGDVLDVNGKPVMKFGPNNTRGSTPDSSVNPDAQSLIPRKGDPNRADLFVHFESPLPASLYHLELAVAGDGSLSIIKSSPVDFSAWGGVWTPCAGSLSPWGSHLGSEEYEPDARAFYASSSPASRVRDFARYWGLYPGDFNSSADYMTAVRKVMSPYMYGFVTETMYDTARKAPVVKKWYTLGRVAVEMALVMPDQKTVYITDDGANVGFFMFKADKAADLTKGRLYAAKFNQTSPDNGGSFDITWVELGRVDQDAIAAVVRNVTFADIFDTAAPAAGACPAGYKAVKHSYGEECLQLKEGKEMWAAALETRRYAAYLGATTEWTKWEGITYDSKRRKLYTAITEMLQGTQEEPTRFGGLDHIRIPANPCGCVYTLDTDASHTATRMYALTCGSGTLGLVAGAVVNNTCHIERISNPDNVMYVGGGIDVLFIAEDSDNGHENNVMWQYDLRSGDMHRVLSAPVGAEVTGTGWFTLPNGASYLFSNLQHPYGGYPAAVINAPEATGLGGYIGYFGPFKMGRGEALGLQAIPTPSDAASKHSVTASKKAVQGTWVPSTYHVIGRSGQEAEAGVVLGRNLDATGHPVASYDDQLRVNTSKEQISNSPDFSSITSVCDKTFYTTQFEYDNPASMYIQSVEQDADGVMSAAAAEEGSEDVVASYVDWSSWGGLLTPCAGSLSPWATRIGSEEYEPDARAFAEATSVESIGAGATPATFTYDGSNALKMGRLYGLYYGNGSLAQFKELVKPYLYGYITETKIQYDLSSVPQKHYLLGRVATELALVMPDKRTVYITDDGANVGFYKFIADTPGDLSCGSLYALKVTQTDAANGGQFRVDWIWLAHGTQDKLMTAASDLTFADIFETAAPLAPTAAAAAGTCPAGFKPTNGGGRSCECLKVKAGMEMYAAFFETRRYAGILGATTEFSKWEGITYDPHRNKLYTSISDVREGMEDFGNRGANSSKWDGCTNNDVRLKYNRCGCVYALDLDGTFNAYHMAGLVCGTPTSSGLGWVSGNRCHMDRIASPDNVAYMPEHDTLIIGEDTSEHQNDVIWSYDLTTQALTRIFTTPYGSETTSPYWYGDVNGHAYITATVQHPYGESDSSKANETGNYGLQGTWGVVGPFPVYGTGATNGGATTAAASVHYLGRRALGGSAAMASMGDYDDMTPAEACAGEESYVVQLQVSYERSAMGRPVDVERLDAYVCARIDNVLAQLSGGIEASDATRVATTCAYPRAGMPTPGLLAAASWAMPEGDQAGAAEGPAVIAHVQFADRATAKAFCAAVMDAAGDFQAAVADLMNTLSEPHADGRPAAAAFTSFLVEASSPKRMARTDAYVPPGGKIF
ncbi:hypothetical protein HXX76_013904 [Chlamydomonas incerta]|uniref:Alkaline phosphatase n=1 Tax=Chlamydomonas incerta TaxID=51695 RepID=A0A835SR96_CHLIN|nr:hypothetical protein HXX76_013904 [Chlamydomonas incerta]|eukprot:KAG2425150.1 hypothetical protein HXX76_013904 [Chlamydomonas incerta]